MILLVLLLGMTEAFAEPQSVGPTPLEVVDIKSERPRYDLSSNYFAMQDTSRKLTIDQVSSPKYDRHFKLMKDLRGPLGEAGTVWWIRFTLREASSSVQKIVKHRQLHLDWHNHTRVTLYTPAPDSREGAPGWTVMERGEARVPGSAVPSRSRLNFTLPELSETPRTFYLRVESDWSVVLRLLLLSGEAKDSYVVHEMFFFGGYYGAVLAMAIYNFFLFLFLRDRNYGWYVFYVLCLSGYFFGINGLMGYYVLPGHSEMTLRLTLIFLGLSVVGMCYFAKSFLCTRQYSPNMDRSLMALAAISGILVLAGPFVQPKFLSLGYNALGFVVPGISVVATLSSLRRGFRPARFLLPAWLSLCSGAFIYALTFRGFIPYSTLSFHSLQIGGVFEAALLSFALADRVRILRREREDLELSRSHYKELAFRDAMTGLFNTRYFKTRVLEEIARAESHAQPLSLLILDLDFFKNLNDRYGHSQGDVVLSGLGEVLRRCVRDCDVPCRYGGEEFAVLLPGANCPEALRIAERVRERIAAMPFETEEGHSLQVTVSIGLAVHRPGEDSSTLFVRADKALYRAKSEGRNRVVSAEVPFALSA